MVTLTRDLVEEGDILLKRLDLESGLTVEAAFWISADDDIRTSLKVLVREAETQAPTYVYRIIQRYMNRSPPLEHLKLDDVALIRSDDPVLQALKKKLGRLDIQDSPVPGFLLGVLSAQIHVYRLVAHKVIGRGKFEVLKTKNGKFMFNLKAGNGEVILTSQIYEAKSSALQGIESVRAHTGLDELYERKTTARGEPYFILKSTNGQVIGQSEMYSSTSAMESGISSVKKNSPAASVVERAS